MSKRNHKEIEQLFKALNFEPDDHWFESSSKLEKKRDVGVPFIDKAQMIDPMVRLLSEVEQPTKYRNYLKKWRSGAEMRFKLPYYPDVKEPSKSFSYA